MTKLHEIVDRTNAAHPDVVCILGDLVIQGVIGGRFVAPEEIGGALKHLHAPAGVNRDRAGHGGDRWRAYRAADAQPRRLSTRSRTCRAHARRPYARRPGAAAVRRAADRPVWIRAALCRGTRG